MSYLGQVELKSSEIRRVDVTGSTSATHTLTWTPASEQSLIITINGIKQQNNYSISGTTLTLDDALISTDEMEVIGILDIGEAVTPPDDSISTAKIQDDAVTADKLANSINTEITANTAKVTNATHTGDVTGATALTIATDAVDIAMLSATGTADATTFLRGDNAWAAPGGGVTEADWWRLSTGFNGDANPIATNLERVDTMSYAQMGTGMSESSGIFTFPSTGYWWVIFNHYVYTGNDVDVYMNEAKIEQTNDNSSYSVIAQGDSSLRDYGQGYRQTSCTNAFIDVTSTTLVKVRFSVDTSYASMSTIAVTDYTKTGFSFIRLGDT